MRGLPADAGRAWPLAGLLLACLLTGSLLACATAVPPSPLATAASSHDLPGTEPPAAATPSPTAAAGPPFPERATDQLVYDAPGVLSAPTEGEASQLILQIEEATGAEIVVYTQLKRDATTASTEADARELLEQWGVGRSGGGDDGLVILFNLDQTLCHGQVQLFAGDGLARRLLPRAERQRLVEEDILPLLDECDIGGAVLVALERIAERAGAL